MNPTNFFTELKRRNVYKVAVAYAVVGWLLIQVATQVFPFLEIPNWMIRLVILLTALGFPIALIIAWAFELTPEGIKRTEDADAARQHSRGGIWIGVVVVAAMLSLGLFFLGRYTAGRATSQGTTRLQRRTYRNRLQCCRWSTPVVIPATSIFPTVSRRNDRGFAVIPDLKVIGRSSSFLLQGQVQRFCFNRSEARCRQPDRRQRAQAGQSCSHRCRAH